MRTVYKYVIPTDNDVYYLSLPFGSEILYAREQFDSICVWAMVEKEVTLKTNHVIRLAGTGHTLDNGVGYRHLGSAHLNGGNLIVHVFEEIF